MSDFSIRPAQLGDATAELPDLLPDRWQEGGNRRSFSALVDGQVVGYARGIDNSVHPNSRVLVVEVLPEFRRRGIGTALTEAVLAVSALPLTLKLESSDAPARGLARKLGAIAYQRCPPWRYPITPELRSWARGHTQQARPLTTADLPAVLDLNVAHYVRQHQAWSPASTPAVRDTFSTEFTPTSTAIDTGRSMLCDQEGRLTAAAVVYRFDEEIGGSEVALLCAEYGTDHGRVAMEDCLAGAIERCSDRDVLLIDSHATEVAETQMMREVPQPAGAEAGEWVTLVAIPVPGGPNPIPLPPHLTEPY